MVGDKDNLPDSELPEGIPFPAQTGSGAESSELDALQSAIFERQALQDQLLRTRAEMENFRKRMNREREEERKLAPLPMTRDLLPAIDNLRRAVEAGEKSDRDTELVNGVRMVLKQLEDVLTRHGAEPIAALGLPFDPHSHEALQQVPTNEHPPLTVIQELERGFKIHDRVVRPSKVIVASAPASGAD